MSPTKEPGGAPADTSGGAHHKGAGRPAPEPEGGTGGGPVPGQHEQAGGLFATVAYLAVWAVLFAVAALVTVVSGPNWVAIAVFPIPVGLYTARGHPKMALGLVCGAVLAGTAAMSVHGALMSLVARDYAEVLLQAQGPLAAGLYYGLEASTGLLLGWGIRRNWRYGHIVIVTACAAFAVSMANQLLAWEVWQAQTAAAFDFLEEGLRAQAEEYPESAPVLTYESLAWLRENMYAFAFGLNFAIVLMAVCVAVSLMSRWVEHWYAMPGADGRFTGMRPPDWFVWVAIAVAGFWFLDQYWHQWALRAFTWNAAVVVWAVYWLNGLGLFLYGVQVLRPNVLLFMAAVLALLAFNPVWLPSFVGLFDTWVSFRRKLHTIAVARSQGGSGNDK